MENYLTKNVLISILVSILIIAGAFWSRLTNGPRNNIADIEDNSVATISYQKEIKENSALFPSDEDQNTSDLIQVADLPNVNNTNAQTATEKSLQTALPDLTAAQKFWLTPSPSTVPYEEIKDRTTIYPSGIEKYQDSDIQTSDTNRASLIAYGKTLVKTINGYPYYISKTPTEITLSLSNNFSENNIKLLGEMLGSYSNASINLIQINVPKEIAKMHVDLANSFDRTAQLISSMKNIKSDKLLAVNSARQYIEESKITLSILLQINKYYKDRNIDLGDGNKLSARVEVLN